MTECYKRIREAMQLRGKTQAELCELTGIPKSAMSQYVSGKFIPKQTRIYLLSKALNVNEAWLMGYDVPIDRVGFTIDYSQIEARRSFCQKYYPEYSNEIEHLLMDIDKLSDEGVNEACKRVHELTLIQTYSNEYDFGPADYTQNIAAGTGEEGFTDSKINEVNDFAKQIYDLENDTK